MTFLTKTFCRAMAMLMAVLMLISVIGVRFTMLTHADEVATSMNTTSQDTSISRDQVRYWYSDAAVRRDLKRVIEYLENNDTRILDDSRGKNGAIILEQMDRYSVTGENSPEWCAKLDALLAKGLIPTDRPVVAKVCYDDEESNYEHHVIWNNGHPAALPISDYAASERNIAMNTGVVVHYEDIPEAAKADSSLKQNRPSDAEIVEKYNVAEFDQVANPELNTSPNAPKNPVYQALAAEKAAETPKEETVPTSGGTTGGNTGTSEPSGTATTEPTELVVVPTSQRLTVNGVEKKTEIYNINGSNYFKLRDMAMLLNGTGSQFSVAWNAANETIAAKTGEAYTPVGGELVMGEDKSATTVPSAQKLVINGASVSFTAYNIGGNNFFKLRDLGSALNFGVDWDETTKTMLVTSAKS